MTDFSAFVFHEILHIDDRFEILDLSNSADIEGTNPYTIGKYNEVRKNMYRTEAYIKSHRNIHVGIDIGAPPGTELKAFFPGMVAYAGNNDFPQDYGPTLVTKHILGEFELFALWGHLTKSTLELSQRGRVFQAGEVIAQIGAREENGGWTPHLHFQLGTEDPGRADMPGVVSKDSLEAALRIYPDPRLVLGPIY